MEIIDGIIAKIDRLKRLLELKDAKFEKLERLKKAREEDVQCLEKHIAELKEQNQKLSAQVENHLEEKSNGNWAKEGAVVWHGKQEMKGVLVYNNKLELKFVGYRNNTLLNFEFNPYMGQIEPYKGQDKEEVEDVIFENTIEVGEIWQSNKHENRVVVITQIDHLDESTQELGVMNLKTWERAEKGSYQFLRGDYLLENFTKKTLD